MPERGAKVSVVVATRNRASSLRELLASLERQTLDHADFEVVIVDDASTDATPSVIAAAERGPLRLKGLRTERAGGPAAARNLGWRGASAPVIAFTDDDCVATPAWLERGLAAVNGDGGVVQGRTDPNPAQAHRLSPFSRTIEIHSAGPAYETCNIFYPRALLERLGGFDQDNFPLPGGEDTDLAWRAKAAGTGIAFAPDARVYHEVSLEGPLAMFRYALRREKTMPLFAKHPPLRRAQLHLGVFWSPTHAQLLAFLAALPLLSRRPRLALMLARPYLFRLAGRRSRGLLAPYILAYDLVETYSVVRGAVRNRVLVV